jgi:TolA-binding protein
VEKFLAQALYRAGACAGRLENWKTSQQHYEAMLAQFPKSEHVPEARYGLGWAQKKQGLLPAARASLELVTKETEAEAAAKARFMIGEIAFEEKKYDEAIEHFLTVAVGYPFAEWQGLARFEAARCFEQLKQKDKAIESLQIVVEKFPTHPKAKLAAEMIVNLKK